VTDNQTVASTDPLAPKVAAPVAPTGAEAVALTPDTSDVPPIYMAIVAKDDADAVMDVIALVPANKQSTVPTAFRRKLGKWVLFPEVMNDLRSATPPPVVKLDEASLKGILDQMEGAAVTASASHALMVLFGPDPVEMRLRAAEFLENEALTAGLLDKARNRLFVKNKGNAEKLRQYWTTGKGAAKIRWNTGGDWKRCVRYLSKYLGKRAKGYCALRHKEVTGLWTGDQAHRKMYGWGKNKAFSTGLELLASTEVLLASELSAKANAARARLGLTAAATTSETGAAFVIPLAIPEGVESGDGRIFRKGSLTTREFPLPLMWQMKTAEGHSGSVVVGRIDSIDRLEGGLGNARGVFDTGEYGKEAERMVRHGFLRGVSADLDKFEAEEPKKKELSEEEAAKGKKLKNDQLVIDKARVMAITIVPKPAFQECSIVLAEDLTQYNQEDTMIPNGVYVDDVDSADAQALVACGMIAGAIPLTPPTAWFENPKLDKPTPLTVTDDGRVYGHIAAWHVDHIGMAFGTRPPRSKSNYGYFHTGVIRTEEGTDMPVGQLTLAGGHAGLEASASEAAKHYDDTGSAFADVHAGEDRHGIWVSGALRPGTSPEQVRAIRASAPSGDWRPIRGSLELVAVCQVNVPGFPIARARVASGQIMALVAAGASTLAKLKSDPLTELTARLNQLERDLHGPSPEELAAKALELSTRVKATADLNTAQEYEDQLAFFSRERRQKLAKEGKALPDGSFPIVSESDLKNAIQAYGRASNKAAARRHIMKRARSLKKYDLVPEEWRSASADGLTASVQSMRDRIAKLETDKQDQGE
jgi:hypothetical protein